VRRREKRAESTREMCDAPTTRTQRRDSHVVLSDCNGTDSGLSATKEKVDPMNVPSTVAGEFGGQSVRRQVDE
jgi:hypothetical protein